MYQLKIIMI